MHKATLSAILLAGVAAVSVFAQSSFGLHVPDGWIDVSKPAAAVDKIPPGVVQEARSGKYVVYAVDPAGVDPIGAKVSFNAIEQPKTGVVTEAGLHQMAAEMTRGMEGTPFSINVMQMHLDKIDGATVGVLESMMETPRGSMRLLQYVVPGKQHSIVLTYGCPPAQYDQYLPIFRSSANATTGAYNQQLFNWRAVVLAGVLGAVGAAMIAMVSIGLGKKKPAPAVVAAAPAAVWDCPACKRRVPLRIEQCRCGAVRPV